MFSNDLFSPNITNVDRVELTQDIIQVSLAYMIGESFTYDYIYASDLIDYEPEEYYKIVGLDTLKKGRMIEQTIIDIADNNLKTK